jgi:hypothetical protein
MRTSMAAWTVGAMVAGSAAVSAQEAPEPPTAALTVTVHVTDYANLSLRDLATAQAHATRAYRAAGLDIVWSSAPWVAGPAPDAGAPSIDVRLVIVPRDMADKKCRAGRLGKGVMGTAIRGAGEANGRIAYVFYDRIARVALSQLTPIEHGLGHVMAHEVGHLLIGENSHADVGLMQANWNPRDSRLQTFTASQVQTIRHRFTTTSAN